MQSDEFDRWAHCDDADLDLARAALAVARDEYPDLDPEPHLARLDSLAREVMARLGDGAGATQALDALDHQLFRVEGFSGNRERYYDPRNSYLNDVLDRRRGIPITLCVIYLEVGWRLGLDLVPIGFPGHFLVALRGSAPPLLVDPFHAGRRPGEADLVAHLEAMLGIEAARHVLPRAVTPVPRREVVARILRNLKTIHVQAGEWARALRTVDRLVSLQPDSAPERRDRGQLYEKLDAHRAAMTDYMHYLELAPDAQDVADIEARIARLQPLAARLN